MQMVPLPPPLRPTIWGVVGQSAQLTALLNGSTDVTTQTEWSVTGATFATVRMGGVLTLIQAGSPLLRATYQTRTVSTFVTVFRAPPTTTDSFSDVVAPRGRRPYFVTVGSGGGDVVFFLTSQTSALSQVAVLFGAASGDTCSPPYSLGTNWGAAAVAGGVESDARGAAYQVAPGRVCVILLDPAAITANDQVPQAFTAALPSMTIPVNYTLTIAASGVGASVVGGR